MRFPSPEDQAWARARPLQLMAFDVDGVMSDGSLFYSDTGVEIKAFNTLDGLGLKLLQEHGVEIAIITGRKAHCVELRAAGLGITHLYQGVHDKRTVMQQLLATTGIDPSAAGYMGDDLVDLPVMTLCGLAAAPGDAHPFVLQHAHYRTQRPGGRGAVRELCDFILEAKGLLDGIQSRYLQAAG